MSKSPDAFRTISEVADWLGVQAHVLRFWESRFNQIKPVKRAGGRRYYRPNDMRLLGGIKKLLHEDGVTIKGVQRILREQGVAHVAALSPGLDENTGQPVATDQKTQGGVVPFAPSSNSAQGRLELDAEPLPVSDRPAGTEMAQAAPTADTGPLSAGIASRAWRTTQFDTETLRKIAPVARDLRAWLNRVENHSAG